jgi:hypothetical protein
MRTRPERLVWIASGLAFVSGILFVLTLVWKDWIELVFGVDPDGHDGSLEWLIVLALLASTVTFAALARKKWRRVLAAGS